MKKMDFYEFAGVLAPGVIAIYGLSRIYPDLGLLVTGADISFGELGLLLVLAYVAGHLVQSLGNLLEIIWWKCAGGWPCDWIRIGRGDILAGAQFVVLPARIRQLLQLDCPDDLTTISEKDWRAISKQAYTVVRKAGRSERIDIFNGNYGMFRGIAASLIVILAAYLVDLERYNWRLIGAFGVMLGLSLLRMHRFGVHYSRELFLQFIGLTFGESAPAKKEAE